MKIESRYSKVPCFGRDPKVDIELLRRLNQPRDPSRGWRLMGWVAIATTSISAVILIITILRYILTTN